MNWVRSIIDRICARSAQFIAHCKLLPDIVWEDGYPSINVGALDGKDVYEYLRGGGLTIMAKMQWQDGTEYSYLRAMTLDEQMQWKGYERKDGKWKCPSKTLPLEEDQC